MPDLFLDVVKTAKLRDTLNSDVRPHLLEASEWGLGASRLHPTGRPVFSAL